MSKQFAQPPLLYLSSPNTNNNNNNNQQVTSSNLDTKISPSILLIIIILAIIFFISGLLHLLVRCLLRSTPRHPDDVSNVTALQGQLRQLFHLHDSGVDQSYIDTLPVFHYKAIIGVKDPFDCAVCLCEFEPDDKLRLLPKCSHAFHMECIDTWLLSHSTCPLCRFSLLSDCSSGHGHGHPHPIPIVCVLESGGESESTSREIRGSEFDSDLRTSQVESGVEQGQIELRKEEDKVVMVKLGKFGSNEENKNEESISRRCYSMRSFAYVMDEGSSLQVQVKELMKEKSNNKRVGNRGAMSEYGGNDSRREFNVFRNGNENRKKESFSVSKIWQRGIKKEMEWKRNDRGSKRELFNGLESFRSIEFRINENGNENSKRDSFSISKMWQIEEREWKGNECGSKRIISEIEIEDCEIEKGDEETQSVYSMDSIANSTSSHRRTLLWLMGRHNKVVHNHSSSSSSIV